MKIINMINNIKPDGFCKRTTAIMGIFAAVIVAISLTDSSVLPIAAQYFGFFAWGIAACALLSLYFDMLGHIFAATGLNARLMFCIADAAALFLKLLIVPQAFSFADDNALFLLFAVFAADAFLSRAYMLFTCEKTEDQLKVKEALI